MIDYNKTYSLDLGSSAPVEMKIIQVTDQKVIVAYQKSTPGRTEEFSIKDFNQLSGENIKPFNIELDKDESYENMSTGKMFQIVKNLRDERTTVLSNYKSIHKNLKIQTKIRLFELLATFILLAAVTYTIFSQNTRTENIIKREVRIYDEGVSKGLDLVRGYMKIDGDTTLTVDEYKIKIQQYNDSVNSIVVNGAIESITKND